jgi:hypothetical protein
MSALAELSQALTSLTATITPSVVGIGSRLRGSGVVAADGQVLTNAHNVRGDEVTVTFPGGRTATGTVAGIDVDGHLAVIAVDTAGATPIGWADGDGPAVGSVVFGAAATPGGGARVTFGTASGIERSFRGPGGRQIGGSIEHTGRWRPARPAARCSTPTGASSGSTRTDRRGLLPGPAGRLRPPGRVEPWGAASPSPGRGSGSRSLPVASPATSARRSACRSATASSSGPSRTTVPRRRPESATVT